MTTYPALLSTETGWTMAFSCWKYSDCLISWVSSELQLVAILVAEEVGLRDCRSNRELELKSH